MAFEKLTVTVQPRGKPIRKLPKEVNLEPTASTYQLYETLSKTSGLSIHRLRITKGSDHSLVPNAKDATIQDAGLREESTVHVKDLGPQISWRTVFIVEYFGPLVIPPLFLFALRDYVYFNFEKPLPEPSSTQLLVCALLVVHFLKREFETIFIHRFSNATMPARNIFKNSAHYWAMAGFNIAYWVFRPDAAAANENQNPAFLYSGLAVFAFGEMANLNSHLVLRNLRRPGTTERGIPSGFGFNLVTCPNYLFEVISWLGIWLVSTLSWSVLIFTIVGGMQMMQWAAKKERRYRKEFGDKYKRKRHAMIPGVF